MSKKKKDDKSAGRQTIIANKKARFNFEILDKFEAGLVLTGNEIKSIRAGNVSLAESYVRPIRGELFLINAHIREYEFSSAKEYDPIRPRKLLLHRREIDRLKGRVEAKGLTIVPLRIYLKRGRAKLEIGLARGKAAPDKRRSIQDRDRKREAERALKEAKR